MSGRRTPRSSVLALVLCAGGLGVLWLAADAGTGPGDVAPGPVASEPAAPSPRRLAPVEDEMSPRAAVRSGAPARDSDDGAAGPTEGAADRAADEMTEKELRERFLARPLDDLEAEADAILRGAGPDPEKVALLRVLSERDSARSAELHLLALRELPDVSDPRGESVPSTVLLLLDRRSPGDALAREVLRRAAFEEPHPPPDLRNRAAASFFLRATEDELLDAGADLAREHDPRFLESALAALSCNPNTRAAAMLLAPHGRTPVEDAERVERE